MFNPSFPPMRCGIGDYSRGLAQALTQAGHDVSVVTATSATASSEGPPRVLPVVLDWSVRDYLRAWPRFSRPGPDLVISGYPSVMPGRYARLLFLLPGLAKLTLGRPRTTFVVHEFVRTGRLDRTLLWLALRAADRIVTVTEAERDAIVAQHPWTAARIVVAHNAPSIPAVPPDAEAERRLRTQIAGADRPLVAYFGLLASPAKGFDDLLAAVAGTDAVVAATGELDPEDPYHVEVAATIERLGLAGRVRWLGFLDGPEVGRLLRTADAVVLPFRGGAESGYTSLLAALVNGAAVITTRGPQNPPWLRHEDTALLINPSDPPAIAGALRRLLDDPELAAGTRSGAAEIGFGWEAIVEAVLAPGRTRAVLKLPHLLPAKQERCGQPLPAAIARIGLGAIRRRVLRSRFARVELGGRGVHIEADLDTGIGLHIYRHGWCDIAADAVRHLVGPGDVVVDGGANIGAFALAAASVVGPEGVVHAVEGAPATAALLRRNAAANPGYSVVDHEAVLAEAEGEIDFTTFEPGSGEASLAAGGGGTVVRVRSTTLDALTAPLPRVDLVKLDLEGAELRALRGATRLLADHRPALIIELEPEHLARQGGSVEELEQLLTGAGYQAFQIEEHDHDISFVPMASPWRRPDGEPNIVVVPAEKAGGLA